MATGITVMKLVLFALFLVIVAVGVIITMIVTNKKWGYTEKREEELEKIGTKGYKGSE